MTEFIFEIGMFTVKIRGVEALVMRGEIGEIREINGNCVGLVLIIDSDGDSRGELWVRHTRILAGRDKIIEGRF